MQRMPSVTGLLSCAVQGAHLDADFKVSASAIQEASAEVTLLTRHAIMD